MNTPSLSPHIEVFTLTSFMDTHIPNLPLSTHMYVLNALTAQPTNIHQQEERREMRQSYKNLPVA